MKEYRYYRIWVTVFTEITITKFHNSISTSTKYTANVLKMHHLQISLYSVFNTLFAEHVKLHYDWIQKILKCFSPPPPHTLTFSNECLIEKYSYALNLKYKNFIKISERLQKIMKYYNEHYTQIKMQLMPFLYIHSHGCQAGSMRHKLSWLLAAATNKLTLLSVPSKVARSKFESKTKLDINH